MKVHTTNYYNTFIAIADDCNATKGEAPPHKGDQKTVAALQFAMISEKPYQYTSDDALFSVFAQRNDLTAAELENARKNFFSKSQPCLRTSALGKRYGWGLHFDEKGRIALYGCDTKAYAAYLGTPGLKTITAMKSSK